MKLHEARGRNTTVNRVEATQAQFGRGFPNAANLEARPETRDPEIIHVALGQDGQWINQNRSNRAELRGNAF